MKIRIRKYILLLAAVLPVMAFTLAEIPPLSRKSLSSEFESSGHLPEGSWAQQVLDTMSLESKIGQLFMVAAYSNQTETEYLAIEKLIRNQRIGGLIFMQGTPQKQVELANRYQKLSALPLLISQDAEWGVSMRLENTVKYPRNMTLGAIQDTLLIFEAGMEIGRECKRTGVHVNFAPVVDVNNNPKNPVINDRSFGENPRRVARHGIYFMKGMEYSGVIGCAKHFPGHGDTDTDSHLDLPVIMHSRARLDSVELYPFRQMIRAGVPSVMVAHLYIPALDTTKNRPTTLSPYVVNELLRNELGFRGLSFTDALGMKGVAKFFPPGEADLQAFLAGNDVLLFSGDVPKAVAAIKNAISSGKVAVTELDNRVRKILVAKEWLGLHTNRFTPAITKADELITPDALGLKKRLYQSALTLVKNDNNLIPLFDLGNKKMSVVTIGAKADGAFAQAVKKYTDVKSYILPSNATQPDLDAVQKSLGGSEIVLVVIDGMTRKSDNNYNIFSSTRTFLTSLKSAGKKVVLVIPGNPYSLKNFGGEDAILVAYENDADAQVSAAEAIFGGNAISGKLPVTASEKFREGTGLVIKSANRITFTLPEEAGMDGSVLKRIDSVAKAAIAVKATPGCAVLMMRGNKIVFSKGYGKTEYDGGVAVNPESTLYDLASVTKVAATTIAVMKLAEEGKINLDESIATYLEEFRGVGKAHITLRHLLTHTSGMKDWIPFYMETFDSADQKKLSPEVYSANPSDSFCIRVADGLYMCFTYQDSMWAKILNSDLKTDSKVRYSDLNMIIMERIIRQVTHTTLDQYVDSVFYQKLGMSNTCFNPAVQKPDLVCAPTEVDQVWRKQKVQGYVHDQAAAMFGGVSGHAGLFSNVYDLAKLLYMLENKGSYGGVKYLDASTIELFTSRPNDELRRGLGWDKPNADGGGGTNVSRYASGSTFGHTGFTGICVWVDPEYDLTYIFLSNRTYPDAGNKKLSTESIRGKIHDIAYESIFRYQMQKKPVK